MSRNRKLVTNALISAFVFSGCATAPSRDTARIQLGTSDTPRVVEKTTNSRDSAHESVSRKSANPAAQTQLASYQEEVPTPHEHAAPMIPPAPVPAVTAEEQTALTLEDVEGMALADNPTLVQANAQFQGEQGAAYQAGLPFNPVIGYTSEQIGVNGTAGELEAIREVFQ